MSKVAEIDWDEVWTGVSIEALRRIVEVARKTLKASAAVVLSHGADRQVVRCRSDPHGTFAGAIDVASAASIEVPIGPCCGRDVGILRVADTVARPWTDEDRDLLSGLAACLTSQIDVAVETLRREKNEETLEDTRAHLLAVADRVPGLLFERQKIDAGRSRYTFFGSAKSRLPAVRKMMDDGGAGDFGFVHRDDREVVRAAILRSNLEETDLDLTFRVKDFDQKVRWLRSQSIVRRDAEGTVFWDGLIFDISDLMDVRKNAKPARVAEDKLLLNLDSELRAPLNAIIGLSDALGTDRQPENLATHARNIRLVAESLLVNLNQLAAPGSAAAPGPKQDAPRIDAPVPKGSFAHDGIGGRILLADDLDLNRKLIADMLSLEGHIVECVADGTEAVRMASQHRFDLILMDMVMPLMDGIAATKAIRALPVPACHVPIVALTAHSMRDQLDDCLQAGMDAMLTKPMSMDALNAVVDAWIGGRTKAA